MNLQRWRARAHKLRTHPRRLRFLASRMLWQSGLSTWFTVPLPDGLRLRFYPSSISAALWVSPEERSEDADVLRAVLRPGDRYVDCGANVGHLAVIARSIVGATGSVIAIEANPRIFGYCVGNLKLNGFGDVTTLNFALGESRGTIGISDRRDDDQNRVGDGSESSHVVEMRPLDELVPAGPVTLLKIDVEGYERQVLQGATATLATTDFVYCELSESNCARFGTHPRDVEDLLLSAGFVFARRRAAGWEIVRDHVYGASAEPSTGFNVLAINANKLDELRARLG